MLFGRHKSAIGAKPTLPPRRRAQRRWLYALFASLLFHAVVVPLGLPRLLVAASPEIEVTYLPDLPPADEQPTDNDALAENEKAEPKKEEEPPDPQRRLVEKKPEKKKPEEKKPLEVVPMPNLPMVDQDQFPDEKDNDKAHFLAQKNHRVDEDVQAKERTLEKPPPADDPTAAQGDPNPPSAPTAEQQKVAELLPQPQPQPQPKPAPSAGAQSPLRMRQPGAEMVEPRDSSEGGELTPMKQGSASANGQAENLPMTPSRLGPHDYDRIVGPALAEAERRAAALADHGSMPGHWDKLMRKQDALRASLENFVGKVKVGNQSELGTRKHPFAAFITTMHRQIHRYWGDGFLAQIGYKSKDLYPDSLETALEISIAADGKVDGVTIVKHSGSLPFDTAAMDSVMSAAPFPPPPDTIKSADGMVYLTWHFHRDERQCHPNYVDMHILTTPPPPGKKPPPPVRQGPSLLGPLAGPERPRLASSASSSASSYGGASGPFNFNPPGAASSSGSSSKGSATAAPAESSPPSSSRPGGGVAEGARTAADRWLAAYQKSDARWLAGASGLPFTAGGKQVADDGPALRRFFAEMLSEGVPRRERVTYYTPSQIKNKLGKLPRGGDDDDMVYAFVELSGEDLILLVAPTDSGWSVVGLDR